LLVNFLLLFNDGDKYYYSPDGLAITSGEIAELRGTDDSEVIDNFIHYSKASFTIDISGKSMYDLFQNIVHLIGFDPKKARDGYCPLYILISNELVYIENLNIDIQSVLDLYPVTDTLQTYFIFSSQAGDIWREDGLRYYLHSREAGRHNIPHVHVDYQHEADASLSIETGEILAGNLPRKAHKKAKKRILENQPFLRNCWRKKTDGLSVDLNYSFGYIEMKT